MREPYTDYIPDDARRAGWDEFAAAMRDKADLGQAYARALHAAAPLILAAGLELLAERDAECDGDEVFVPIAAIQARIAGLRHPAAVTPEPAEARVWADSDGDRWEQREDGLLYCLDDGNETNRARGNLTAVERQYGPLTEVVPAEPEAGT